MYGHKAIQMLDIVCLKMESDVLNQSGSDVLTLVAVQNFDILSDKGGDFLSEICFNPRHFLYHRGPAFDV